MNMNLNFLRKKNLEIMIKSSLVCKVGKIMDLKEQYDVMSYMIETGLASNPDKEKAQYGK